MIDYSKLGLNDQLQSFQSPISKSVPDAMDIDLKNGITPGAINYTAVGNAGREYKAIVAMGAEPGIYNNIQQAIDYVNRIGGGNIFINAGTYVISSNLTMYSNIHLIGEDYNTTVFNFNSGTNIIASKGVVGTRKRNMIFENLQFKTGRAGTEGVISFQYADDCYVRNCYFTDNYDSTVKSTYDIKIDNCDRMRIFDNQSVNSFRFCVLSSDNYYWAERNYITGNYGDAWNITTSNYVFINNNFLGTSNLVSTENAMVYAVSTGVYMTVHNNQFIETSKRIIYFNGANQAFINNNFLVSNGTADYNIYLIDSNRVTINSNFLKVAQTNAIRIDNSDMITIVGNVLTDNASGTAILIDSNSGTVGVVGNVFHNNPGGRISNLSTGGTVDANAPGN
ncbi:MAG: hypothetical protein HYS80_02255 [Candidatus Aenigmarchaeota archaeon]|nr:hypothetical protein [Candidatus Aenigmarchaeota archaeon]